MTRVVVIVSKVEELQVRKVTRNLAQKLKDMTHPVITASCCWGQSVSLSLPLSP